MKILFMVLFSSLTCFAYAQDEEFVKAEMQKVLTEKNILELESKFGNLDYSKSKVTKLEDNKIVYSVPFVSKSNELKKFMIAQGSIKGNDIYELLVTELTNNEGSEIKADSKITDGFVRLNFLNTGLIYQKTFMEGTEKVIESNEGLKFSEVYSMERRKPNQSFGSCFKTCYGNEVSGFSAFEWVMCLANAELCIAGLTIGCAGSCSYQ